MDTPTKTGLMRWGVGVDGVSFYTAVTIPADCEVCKQCEGTGKWSYNAAHDGFERIEECECENCDGEGVVYCGSEEDE
jgi:hypothetical protein